jgi:hypothetical protein
MYVCVYVSMHMHILMSMLMRSRNHFPLWSIQSLSLDIHAISHHTYMHIEKSISSVDRIYTISHYTYTHFHYTYMHSLIHIHALSHSHTCIRFDGIRKLAHIHVLNDDGGSPSARAKAYSLHQHEQKLIPAISTSKSLFPPSARAKAYSRHQHEQKLIPAISTSKSLSTRLLSCIHGDFDHMQSTNTL